MKPKLGREAILDWTKSLNMHAGKTSTTYQVKFVVDSNFEMPGAILVSNKDESEFYLNSINIEGVIHFACNSWVQPERKNPAKRIFFSTNKVNLKFIVMYILAQYNKYIKDQVVMIHQFQLFVGILT